MATTPRRRPNSTFSESGSSRPARSEPPPARQRAENFRRTASCFGQKRPDEAAEGTRHGSHHFFAARFRHGASSRRPGDFRAMGAHLQRSDPSHRRDVPEEFRRCLPAAAGRPASPEKCIPELERCVKELGFVGCNLNPDPSGGYWNRSAAHRQMVVSALREDGRARRAGDDPRQRLLQSGTSMRPARITSMPTRRPSCSSSRATCSRTFRR